MLTSLHHVDIILLRIFVGSRETGYYRAALVLAEFLWFAPVAIQTALLHSISKLWLEERYNQITNISARIVRYTLLLTLLFALGMAGLSDPLLSIYFGEEFTISTVPLLLLLPGALGFAVARPIFAINQAQDNLRILMLVTVSAAGLNILMNLALIPSFGMRGAAVATSTAYSTMFGLHVWTARRLGFNPLADIRIKSVTITVLISAVPIIVLPQFIVSNVLSLVVVPFVGLLIFVVTAIKTRSIELKEMRQTIPANTLISK